MSKSASVHLCARVRCPYSHTHVNVCAVIPEAATHVHAGALQLKVLSVSVSKSEDWLSLYVRP